MIGTMTRGVFTDGGKCLDFSVSCIPARGTRPLAITVHGRYDEGSMQVRSGQHLPSQTTALTEGKSDQGYINLPLFSIFKDLFFTFTSFPSFLSIHHPFIQSIQLQSSIHSTYSTSAFIDSTLVASSND